VTFSRRLNAGLRWRDLSTFTMIAGIVVLLLFVVVGFFAIDAGAPLHPWVGLIQRIICAVWFTCLVVLAFRLRLTAKRSELALQNL
jgi:succinate dehydrogenase hydrophobic anchor subunit